MLSLPVELRDHIATYLQISDYMQFASTCRQTADESSRDCGESILRWERFLSRDYGLPGGIAYRLMDQLMNPMFAEQQPVSAASVIAASVSLQCSPAGTHVDVPNPVRYLMHLYKVMYKWRGRTHRRRKLRVENFHAYVHAIFEILFDAGTSAELLADAYYNLKSHFGNYPRGCHYVRLHTQILLRPETAKSLLNFKHVALMPHMLMAPALLPQNLQPLGIQCQNYLMEYLGFGGLGLAPSASSAQSLQTLRACANKVHSLAGEFGKARRTQFAVALLRDDRVDRLQVNLYEEYKRISESIHVALNHLFAARLISDLEFTTMNYWTHVG